MTTKPIEQRLAEARARLDLCQSRVRKADDAGRRHTAKMTGDLWAARRAVEELEQEITTSTDEATAALRRWFADPPQ